MSFVRYTLSAMLKNSSKALWMMEWSTIPFSRTGWSTVDIWRKTDDFLSPSLDIKSIILKTKKKHMNLILYDVRYSNRQNKNLNKSTTCTIFWSVDLHYNPWLWSLKHNISRILSNCYAIQSFHSSYVTVFSWAPVQSYIWYIF